MNYEQMWSRLYQWVAERHDFFEDQYTKTNYSADATQLNTYRSVIQGMQDIKEKAVRVDAAKNQDVKGKKRK